MGLAVVSTACCRTSDNTKTRKWAFVIGVPLALTNLVYAVFDRSKFQGYSGLERSPLSSWGAGTFGELDFSRLGEDPKAYWFSVVRVFMSVVINISSVLLVLIDAVCLEVSHGSLVGGSAPQPELCAWRVRRSSKCSCGA